MTPGDWDNIICGSNFFGQFNIIIYTFIVFVQPTIVITILVIRDFLCLYFIFVILDNDKFLIELYFQSLTFHIPEKDLESQYDKLRHRLPPHKVQPVHLLVSLTRH